MERGKLIVFEGVSGTGKETQAKLLQKFLSTKGIKSRIVYHPSTELKKILREWRASRSIDHITEVYLLLADRYDHLRRIIIPALEKGEWVISLRNYMSAMVYQAKTDTERARVQKEFFRFEPKPDLLFYFSMRPGEALERIMDRHKKTGEALGKFETIEALTEKLNAYTSVLRTIAHISVDASRSIEDIYLNIQKSLKVSSYTS